MNSFESGREITRLEFLSMSERSLFTLDGSLYLARKERWNSSNFFLTRDDVVLASAQKPPAMLV
jgi:hypothetical protein